MWIWSDLLLAVALQALLWLGLFLAALLLWIVAHRLIVARREASRSRRLAHYEEQLVLLLTDDLEPLPFLRQVRRPDRQLVEDLLLEYAAKFAPEVRLRMAPVFEGIGAVSRNRRRTRSWLWWRRADAARRLGLMQEETISRSLRQLLRDRQTEVRIATARALIELGANHWLDEVISRLDEPDAVSSLRVADVVLEAGRAAIPGLIRFAQSIPNPRSRVVAIEILGDMRALAARDVIMAAAGAPNKEVRAAACRALGRLEAPEAVDLLCATLQDEAWEVRNQAVRALGAIGDPAAIPYLVPQLQQGEVWAVYRAARALAQMQPEGYKALQQELYHMQCDQYVAAERRVQIMQEVLCEAKARGRSA